MKLLAFFIWILVVPGIRAVDWAVPAINQGAWTTAGVDGGMLQYIAGAVNDRALTGTVLNVTQPPYSVDNTGVSNVSVGVQAAIDASAPGDVVYFPAGTYRFTSAVFFDPNDSGITIRGAGPASTTLIIATGTNGKGFTFAEGAFPPYSPAEVQIVTGTKTKGTTTFTIPSSAGFTVGSFAFILVENEENNARIQAGAAPTWNSIGYRDLRKVFTKVTAVGSGTVTLKTPLPWDCTNEVTKVAPMASTTKISDVGFEDFTLSFVSAAHATNGIEIITAENCWVYNVHSTDWTKNTSSGQPINMWQTLNCEVRKCRGIVASPSTAGDDGFIQIYHSSSALLVDNIMSGWDNGIYEFGATFHSVFAYNYISVMDKGIVHHNSHTSLVLVEGNCLTNFQSDGYHGSASHQTYYRNWINALDAVGGNSFVAALNRFVRYTVFAGNINGEDGRIGGAYSFGNPNIGNSAFTGDTQPTAGDFWADWAMTGTLTTRTSDTTGVVTASGGDFGATTGGGITTLYLWWNSFANGPLAATITGRTGLAITVSTGATLPVAGTTFNLIRVGPAGFQERDLDVQASTTLVENYDSNGSGTGGVTNGTADTLPNSLYLSAKPTWFGNLAWPAYEPNSPVFNKQRIPAGYRFVNGTDPPPDGPDTTPPTLSTVSVPSAGTTLVLTFNEAVNFVTGDLSGWSMSLSGGVVSMSAVSGDGTPTITGTLSRTVNTGETGTISYTQPGNGVEDLAGNDLASLSGRTVTNNSTQGGATPPPGSVTIDSANVNNLRIGP